MEEKFALFVRDLKGGKISEKCIGRGYTLLGAMRKRTQYHKEHPSDAIYVKKEGSV